MLKSQKALIRAYELGYKVDSQGKLYSYTGKLIKQNYSDSNKYAHFLCRLDGENVTVPVHRLVAYQMFQSQLFEKGIQVRHLDGDTLNNRPSNIGIGTMKENFQDKKPDVRSGAARAAGLVNGKIARALSKNNVCEILDLLEQKVSQDNIADRYGVSQYTISMINRRKRYVDWIDEYFARKN